MRPDKGDTIEKDFTITQDAGIAEVLWRPGIVIGPAELDVLANTITHAPRWRSRPLLIHLDLVRHITPEARQMLVAYHHAGPIALTGSDPVDRVLAAFIAQSRSHTRYFARTGDARDWLSGGHLAGRRIGLVDGVSQQFTAMQGVLVPASAER
jgi:hypothetical protein